MIERLFRGNLIWIIKKISRLDQSCAGVLIEKEKAMTVIVDMDVSGHEEYAGHETVVKAYDPASGLTAFIAVHDTTIGPALGGCRF